MNDYLVAAIETARAAGRLLKERLDAAREVRSKGWRDIVTDADMASHSLVREMLAARFPLHRVWTEEDDKSAASDSPWLWIVDPLDGTTNYSRRYPVFSVSIALLHDDAPVAGVVYDPLREELYTALRGEGAFLNSQPLQVSEVAELRHALVGYEFSAQQALRDLGLETFRRLASQAMTSRIGGSAALSLCYVAAGRLDIYFHYSLHPWDVAAGMLMIREAGGIVSDHSGGPATPYIQRYLATNGRLHAEILPQLAREAGG